MTTLSLESAEIVHLVLKQPLHVHRWCKSIIVCLNDWRTVDFNLIPWHSEEEIPEHAIDIFCCDGMFSTLVYHILQSRFLLCSFILASSDSHHLHLYLVLFLFTAAVIKCYWMDRSALICLPYAMQCQILFGKCLFMHRFMDTIAYTV